MELSEELMGIPRKLGDQSEQIHKIVRKILGIPRKIMDLSEWTLLQLCSAIGVQKVGMLSAGADDTSLLGIP